MAGQPLHRSVGGSLRRGIGAGLVAGVVLAGLAVPAGADTTLTGFVATASADGGRIKFTVPDRQLVEDVIDAGGAVAQAVVTPFNTLSYAALPWPGELAILGPSLFQAVTGQALPGQYPFYVSASHPTSPKQELEDPSGVYQLTATAAGTEASGGSQFRGQSGDRLGSGTRVLASSVAEADTVTAVAESLNEAINLGGGALKIASVLSRSETTFTAGDAAPTSKTQLLIEGGSVGDMTFGFGPDGLVVAKQGASIPASTGLQQLNTALAPAGISLRVASGQPVAGGAAADALEIAFRQGPRGPEFTGAIVSMRFGGAISSVLVGEAASGGGDDDAAVSSPVAGPSEAEPAAEVALPTGSVPQPPTAADATDASAAKPARPAGTTSPPGGAGIPTSRSDGARPELGRTDQPVDHQPIAHTEVSSAPGRPLVGAIGTFLVLLTSFGFRSWRKGASRT